jgi:hypothetical protein
VSRKMSQDESGVPPSSLPWSVTSSCISSRQKSDFIVASDGVCLYGNLLLKNLNSVCMCWICKVAPSVFRVLEPLVCMCRMK